MTMAFNKRPNDGMNATQRYQAKCDCITIRPLKADGEKIRSAAEKRGMSVTQYILSACSAFEVSEEAKPFWEE